jgi:hypothetical protein
MHRRGAFGTERLDPKDIGKVSVRLVLALALRRRLYEGPHSDRDYTMVLAVIRVLGESEMVVHP